MPTAHDAPPSSLLLELTELALRQPRQSDRISAIKVGKEAMSVKPDMNNVKISKPITTPKGSNNSRRKSKSSNTQEPQITASRSPFTTLKLEPQDQIHPDPAPAMIARSTITNGNNATTNDESSTHGMITLGKRKRDSKKHETVDQVSKRKKKRNGGEVDQDLPSLATSLDKEATCHTIEANRLDMPADSDVDIQSLLAELAMEPKSFNSPRGNAIRSVLFDNDEACELVAGKCDTAIAKTSQVTLEGAKVNEDAEPTQVQFIHSDVDVDIELEEGEIAEGYVAPCHKVGNGMDNVNEESMDSVSSAAAGNVNIVKGEIGAVGGSVSDAEVVRDKLVEGRVVGETEVNVHENAASTEVNSCHSNADIDIEMEEGEIADGYVAPCQKLKNGLDNVNKESMDSVPSAAAGNVIIGTGLGAVGGPVFDADVVRDKLVEAMVLVETEVNVNENAAPTEVNSCHSNADIDIELEEGEIACGYVAPPQKNLMNGLDNVNNESMDCVPSARNVNIGIGEVGAVSDRVSEVGVARDSLGNTKVKLGSNISSQQAIEAIIEGCDKSDVAISRQVDPISVVGTQESQGYTMDGHPLHMAANSDVDIQRLEAKTRIGPKSFNSPRSHSIRSAEISEAGKCDNAIAETLIVMLEGAKVNENTGATQVNFCLLDADGDIEMEECEIACGYVAPSQNLKNGLDNVINECMHCVPSASNVNIVMGEVGAVSGPVPDVEGAREELVEVRVVGDSELKTEIDVSFQVVESIVEGGDKRDMAISRLVDPIPVVGLEESQQQPVNMINGATGNKPATRRPPLFCDSRQELQIQLCGRLLGSHAGGKAAATTSSTSTSTSLGDGSNINESAKTGCKGFGLHTSQLITDRSVQGLIKSMEKGEPVAVVMGDMYPHVPESFRRPGKYTVVGWYRIISCWAIKEYVKGHQSCDAGLPSHEPGGYHVRFNFMFQWINSPDQTAWFETEEEELRNNATQLSEPERYRCSTCHKDSPQPYRVSMCLNPDCVLFFRYQIRGSDAWIEFDVEDPITCNRNFPASKGSNESVYREDFIAGWEVPDEQVLNQTELKESQDVLMDGVMAVGGGSNVKLPPFQTPRGDVSKYIFNPNGMDCWICGRITARKCWGEWRCATQGCPAEPINFQSKETRIQAPFRLPGLVVKKAKRKSGKPLSPVYLCKSANIHHSVLAITFHPQRASAFGAASIPKSHPEGPHLPLIDGYQLPCGGNIYHIRNPHSFFMEAAVEKALAGGNMDSLLDLLEPKSVFDAIFLSLLQDPQLPFHRWSFRNHVVSNFVSRQYSFNVGAPYRHAFDMPAASFDTSPLAIQLAAVLMDSALPSMNMNEMLVLGYMEGQLMNYHSDDEKGLSGPVMSLSLGSETYMKFREKKPASKKGKGQGVVPGITPMPHSFSVPFPDSCNEDLMEGSNVALCASNMTSQMVAMKSEVSVEQYHRTAVDPTVAVDHAALTRFQNVIVRALSLCEKHHRRMGLDFLNSGSYVSAKECICCLHRIGGKEGSCDRGHDIGEKMVKSESAKDSYSQPYYSNGYNIDTLATLCSIITARAEFLLREDETMLCHKDDCITREPSMVTHDGGAVELVINDLGSLDSAVDISHIPKINSFNADCSMTNSVNPTISASTDRLKQVDTVSTCLLQSDLDVGNGNGRNKKCKKSESRSKKNKLQAEQTTSLNEIIDAYHSSGASAANPVLRINSAAVETLSTSPLPLGVPDRNGPTTVGKKWGRPPKKKLPDAPILPGSIAMNHLSAVGDVADTTKTVGEIKAVTRSLAGSPPDEKTKVSLPKKPRTGNSRTPKAKQKRKDSVAINPISKDGKGIPIIKSVGKLNADQNALSSIRTVTSLPDSALSTAVAKKVTTNQVDLTAVSSTSISVKKIVHDQPSSPFPFTQSQVATTSVVPMVDLTTVTSNPIHTFTTQPPLPTVTSSSTNKGIPPRPLLPAITPGASLTSQPVTACTSTKSNPKKIHKNQVTDKKKAEETHPMKINGSHDDVSATEGNVNDEDNDDEEGNEEPTSSNANSRQDKQKAPKRNMVLKLLLRHGDILIMDGESIQKNYEHAIEPVSGIRFAITARRIADAPALALNHRR
ncbi:hypothetical protein HDU76_006081 [Blyttiomyces sp. JEL0837]|nr:hypothetical protein HDU76_006081 [Blyttiomyces sp. JEL0837]